MFIIIIHPVNFYSDDGGEKRVHVKKKTLLFTRRRTHASNDYDKKKKKNDNDNNYNNNNNSRFVYRFRDIFFFPPLVAERYFSRIRLGGGGGRAHLPPTHTGRYGY